MLLSATSLSSLRYALLHASRLRFVADAHTRVVRPIADAHVVRTVADAHVARTVAGTDTVASRRCGPPHSSRVHYATFRGRRELFRRS